MGGIPLDLNRQDQCGNRRHSRHQSPHRSQARRTHFRETGRGQPRGRRHAVAGLDGGVICITGQTRRRHIHNRAIYQAGALGGEHKMDSQFGPPQNQPCRLPSMEFPVKRIRKLRQCRCWAPSCPCAVSTCWIGLKEFLGTKAAFSLLPPFAVCAESSKI